MPSNRKEMRREEQKKMGLDRKGNEKVKTAVSLLIPKTKKFCFLCMPELHKQIFCIWIRRLQSVRPVNVFVVCIISLLKARQLPEHSSCLNYLQNTLFGKISRSQWVNEGLMAKKKNCKQIFSTTLYITHWSSVLRSHFGQDSTEHFFSFLKNLRIFICEVFWNRNFYVIL